MATLTCGTKSEETAKCVHEQIVTQKLANGVVLDIVARAYDTGEKRIQVLMRTDWVEGGENIRHRFTASGSGKGVIFETLLKAVKLDTRFKSEWCVLNFLGEKNKNRISNPAVISDTLSMLTPGTTNAYGAIKKTKQAIVRRNNEREVFRDKED